ncbi:DMT family transporter [Undibacterium sp. 14-3-2]|uniref:DMT family transporter n=1 Tax=Undibacterium sp. 14-3-2 TaxID=2800129 RepID=UPI001F3BFC0D|nr:DMT family transporter [Undibacterium sp. 14-3-2]
MTTATTTAAAAAAAAAEQNRQEVKGMWLGLAGVAIFSLTLPFTRLAVTELDPVFVAMGRAVVAALLAAILLWMQKARLPDYADLKALLITAVGVVIGFPLCSTWAMQYVPAAHGAIVLGILPLATALFAAIRFHERPSPGFWLMAVIGSALVIVFALMQGAGHLQWADLALFGAVLAAAMGYAEGGRLAQRMGGLQVIAWALILILPVTLGLSIWSVWQHGLHASPVVWSGFAYVSVFSMFIGFLFWYKGLAIGGIARVGQIQLLQPFMSLFGAAVIMGETLSWTNMGFALAVIVTVGLGRRMKIHR